MEHQNFWIKPMEHQNFWMVWNPDGRQPRFMHNSRDSANVEASRLARENPDQQFFVLKAVAGFVAPSRPVKSIKLRPFADIEIPF